MALYSASVVDRETVGYFLEFHEIRFDPKNVQYPVVDLLESRHPAQSASHYADKDERAKRLPGLISTPKPSEPRRYLNILLTAYQ